VLLIRRRRGGFAISHTAALYIARARVVGFHAVLLESIEPMVGRSRLFADHPAAGPSTNALAHWEFRSPVETTVGDRHFRSDQRGRREALSKARLAFLSAQSGSILSSSMNPAIFVSQSDKSRCSIAPHARFAGANGRAEFILAHSIRAKGLRCP